jgi:hypothetical protein
MFIISNPLFTAGIGFVLGLFTWIVQQQYQDRKNKHRVLTLLYLENAQNLKTLDDFWEQVNNSIKDYRQNDLQKYHRLAYNYLPAWSRLMWESQASLLPLLDENLVTGIYNLNQKLDVFLILRNKMHDIFETEENKKLWNDYLSWMEAYYHDDPNKRDEAQNGEEGRAMDIKVTQFSPSLIKPWIETNACYLHIHDMGNPIPAQKKSRS